MDKVAGCECNECGEEIERNHMLLYVVSVGKTIDYTVPSFPVFKTELTHIQYTIQNDDKLSGTVLDGFIRADGAQTASATSNLRLCAGHENAFLIPLEEFNRSVDITGAELSMFNDELFVLWNWVVLPEVVSVPDSLLVDDQSEIQYVSDSDLEDNNEDAEEDTDAGTSSNDVLHSVVFKCIGSTKEHKYQELLAEMALKKRRGEVADVRIHPEPFNQYDSSAIAIEGFVNHSWERVGYLVREVLENVHTAQQDNKIVSVELQWVKFITHWTRSQPGWYCGIKITRNGSWDKIVMQCASTV